MYDLSILGARIRQLRNQKGYTQDAFAKELGISAQAVSKWETGAGCPDIAMLPLIANILECRIDALFSDVVPEEESGEEAVADLAAAEAGEDEVTDDAEWEDENLKLVYTYQGVGCQSDMEPVSIEGCIVRFPNGGYADLTKRYVNSGNGSGSIFICEVSQEAPQEKKPTLSLGIEMDALDMELDALSAEIDAQMREHDERLKEQAADFAEAERRFAEEEVRFAEAEQRFEEHFENRMEKHFAEMEQRFAEKEKQMDEASYHFDRESYRAAHGEENAKVRITIDANRDDEETPIRVEVVQEPAEEESDAAKLGADIAREVEMALEGGLGELANLGNIINSRVNELISRVSGQSRRGGASQTADNRRAGDRVWTGTDIHSLVIHSTGSADVTVESGTSGQWRVEAEGSQDFLNHVSCMEDGQTLTVEVTPRQNSRGGFFSTRNSITIYTGFTEGEELEAVMRGSGDLDCGPNFKVSHVSLYGSGDAELADAGYLTANTFGSGDFTFASARNAHITSSGSGDVTVGELTGICEVKTTGSGDVEIGSAGDMEIGAAGDALTVRTQGAGDVSISHVTLSEMSAYVSGAGDMEVGSGTVGKLDLTLRGAGDFDAPELTVGDLYAVLSGASDAEIGRVTGQSRERVSSIAASLTIHQRG